MLRSLTEILSQTIFLAEIHNLSQKGVFLCVDLFDFLSSVETYEMEAPGAN